METDPGRYRVKLAETAAERAGAERLRYRVFVEEIGARASPEQQAVRREWDAYDAHCDHLILVDRTVADPLGSVVGAYRLMRDAAARAGLGYYGAGEYELGPIEQAGRPAVELGRSCVAPGHRGGPAMHLMWSALADYVLERRIEILFGVASFRGTDPEAIAEALAYLHRFHLAPEDIRVRARPVGFVAMDRLPPEAIEPRRALREIPPLIQAYLRLGGFVGEGAWLDRDFNTIDVCLILDTARMAERYRGFYVRGWERAAARTGA